METNEKIEYTEKLLVKFLKDLIVFDKDCKSAIRFVKNVIDKRSSEEKSEWDTTRTKSEKKIKSFTVNAGTILSDYEKCVESVFNQDLDSKKSDFERLQKCKEQLTLLHNSESSITEQSAYKALSGSFQQVDITIDNILKGDINFPAKAFAANESLLKKRKGTNVAVEFYNLCRTAEDLLNKEIITLRNRITQNRDDLHTRYQGIGVDSQKKVFENWNSAGKEYVSISVDFAKQRDKSLAETTEVYATNNDDLNQRLEKLVEGFCKQFPPQELANEYSRLYAMEPSFEDYECYEEMPRNIHISSLEYDISHLDLCDYTKSFLNKNYYFMYRGDKISIPFCASFGPEFNYLFRFNGEEKTRVVNNACELGMRLFMMLPPGKLNFTFIDPVTMGDSFAMFMRLIDVNDNTSEIINGKIWSAPFDIEEKLRVMTDHISNITQRCLQGKYDTIYEYNQVAEQNAEAYQVLMLMDFPTGLTDKSLKLLEQIVTSGPKCGVFTILFRSESQFKKMSERSYPLVSNIEKSFRVFDYSDSCKEIFYSGEKVKGYSLQWRSLPLPNNAQLDGIIETLKHGIKNAERIVIGFNKIVPDKSDWFKGDSAKELAIPIGVHGANNIQNLSFGTGGSHHALVAGQTGSGKSSLLHTIIMSALIKYPANQLQIFLVDFKRGVEFKIYANYSLENFKVIAIESEREFGCSVLEYLDKEQSRRADKFKRINVDNVEEYRKRTKETLPRILLIIDEFHVLFSKDTSDTSSKKSAAFLEQIIRQGRAFGIHIILASQTMSNIGGINYGVWGQVGVRIALKCPKSDAKFVLGNDNDAVDLLSADNPGQAVYNSDGGNIVANTVFRVAYIDQEEQDEYLKYISKNEPRFDYPETRVMLSNVEDNIYNPLQKFASGEMVSFAENKLIVGEPLKLVNNMKMTFKKKQGSNLIVIGNDDVKARTLFTFAALSLSLHKFSVNGNERVNKPSIYLFDYAPVEDFDEKDILVELVKRLPSYIKYIPFDEADEFMKELYNDFLAREKGECAAEDTYMFIYGLQRARNLRSNDIYKKNSSFDDFDEFGSSSKKQQLSVKPYEMFLSLLQRGPSVGINSVIWEDNFKVFMNNYADMLPNFDMRIAFTMPDEDSINFIEEVDGSKIGENGAVYNYNGNQKFRPYRKPDIKWIDEITKRMENK